MCVSVYVCVCGGGREAMGYVQYVYNYEYTCMLHAQLHMYNVGHMIVHAKGNYVLSSNLLFCGY